MIFKFSFLSGARPWLALLLGLPLAARAQAWPWATSISTATATSSTRVEYMGTDAAGNVYVAGPFIGRLTLGSTTLVTTGTSSSSYETFLASLTPTGQGDILLPDGTYVEPGSQPPMPGMM